MAVPFLRVEPGDGEFFVVGFVVDEPGHFEVVAAVRLLSVMFHSTVAGGGVGAADEDFDGGADELAKLFG